MEFFWKVATPNIHSQKTLFFDDSTMKMEVWWRIESKFLQILINLLSHSSKAMVYLMKSFFKYKTQAYSKIAANMNNMQPINQISIAFNPAARGDVEL